MVWMVFIRQRACVWRDCDFDFLQRATVFVCMEGRVREFSAIVFRFGFVFHFSVIIYRIQVKEAKLLG